MTEDKKEDATPGEFLCTGMHRMSTGKAYVGLVELTGEEVIDDNFVQRAERDGKLRFFRQETMRKYGLSPGAIYSFKSDGSVMYMGSKCWLRLADFENDATLAAWQTRSRAVEEAVRSNALEKKTRSETIRSINRTMLPLRAAYQDLFGADRLAFEMLVVRALQRPLKDKDKED